MADDQQRARELESLMQAFEAASIEAGYPAPDRNQQGDGYLWQRDHDRFVGFELSAALRAAPEVIRIPAGDGLDPITLYVDDAGNGSGHLTITCYADAWTCYWGSMGCELTKFVAGVGAEYLLSSMLWPNLGSTRKMTKAYVKRIAQRVIDQLAARPQGVK